MTRKTISSVMRYQFENDMYVSLISLFSFFFSFLFLLGPFINPFSLALSLRVAPESASLWLRPRWSFELPRFPHPSARPAQEPCGSALPIAPPDEFASCPASCIFRLCRRPSFELPRLVSFSVPLVEVWVAPPFVLWSRLPIRPPGCPGFCIFRPCRQWIFELPRISHPSAHPALELEVSFVALHSDCAC